MNEIKRAMKLSLIFGVISAVIVPLMYECYANISRGAALAVIAVWASFMGFKLSALTLRSAMLAASAVLAYTLGFGLVAFVIIHPATISVLESNSKYFYLTFSDSLMFVISAFFAMLLIYAVCIVIKAARYAFAHIKSNGERVEAYIDNAFKDGDSQ